MESNDTIVTLGGENTYSAQATRMILPEGVSAHYPIIDRGVLQKLPKIMRAPIGNLTTIEETKNHLAGVVPMYNKYGRNVILHPEAILQEECLTIIGWHSLKIDHILACLPGDSLENIQTIYSHQQALLQCRDKIKILSQQNGEITTINTPGTDYQADKLQPGEAIICNIGAIKTHSLAILDKEIAPEDNNTDFAIITNKAEEVNQRGLRNLDTHKKLITINVEDSQGALLQALKVLDKYDIDLSSIHSHPNGKGGVEFPILINNHEGLDINQLQKDCNKNKIHLHILG